MHPPKAALSTKREYFRVLISKVLLWFPSKDNPDNNNLPEKISPFTYIKLCRKKKYGKSEFVWKMHFMFHAANSKMEILRSRDENFN